MSRERQGASRRLFAARPAASALPLTSGYIFTNAKHWHALLHQPVPVNDPVLTLD